MTYGDKIIDELSVVTDGNASFQTYINGLAQMFEEVHALARDTDDGEVGWSIILDLNRMPESGLPWLAQFLGVETIEGLTESQQRAWIAAARNKIRGTPSAMIQSAQVFLIGSKYITLRERAGDAWQLVVVTKLLETPVEDWAATNTVPNGGFETNTTGWTPSSPSTITRDTSQSLFGIASGKLTGSTSAHPLSGTIMTGSPILRVPYTHSFYFKGSGASIGKTMVIQFNESGGAFADQIVNFNSMVITGAWQRLTTTGTPVRSDRTSLYTQIYITSGGGTDFVYIDGVQLEANIAATPYIETNGGSASRTTGHGPVGTTLLSQKPAGIIMTYSVLSGNDYQLVFTNNASYSILFGKYLTYQGMLNDVPGT